MIVELGYINSTDSKRTCVSIYTHMYHANRCSQISIKFIQCVQVWCWKPSRYHKMVLDSAIRARDPNPSPVPAVDHIALACRSSVVPLLDQYIQRIPLFAVSSAYKGYEHGDHHHPILPHVCDIQMCKKTCAEDTNNNPPPFRHRHHLRT